LTTTTAPLPGAPTTAAAPPVWHRGTPLRAAKLFTEGTHRTRSPESTLEWIRPYFGYAGITRLADITGLDRIGIHTVVAMRPNGRTLSNSSGKGFSLAAAEVSAAMEGIEIHHAENLRLPGVVASYDELRASGPVVELDRLPLTRAALFSHTRPEHWVYAWDLVAQREVPVPHATVALVRHPDQMPRHARPFVIDSNGLASGNHLLEAAAAGLYERIERDALTLHFLAEFRTRHRAPRVRLETIESPLVQDVLERLGVAGVVPLIFDCTVDTGVPTFFAYIYDAQNRNVGVAGGAGSHLDPAIAMIRAITEAVQTRVVYISGSRDDIYRNDARLFKAKDGLAQVARLEAVPPTLDAREMANDSTSSFEGDIAVMIEKLARVGLDEVYLLDLSHEEVGIPVARVWVPGLEGFASNLYTAGPRALAFCKAAA